MVLIVAFGVAAAAYASKNDGGGGGDGGDSGEGEPLDLTDKAGIDLLPLERTLALFEAPIATITFMEGDPAVASDFLRSRVADIAYRNPWLGGWLKKDKSRGNAVRLFHDESSDDLCPGLFGSFEAGEIDLTMETPYEDYGDLFSGHDVLVKNNAVLIQRTDDPLWRVCLIPDSASPTKRFALVVSMSHMCGDGFTYYKVLNMLHTSGAVETLNPKRKHQFSDEVVSIMGRDEAFYVDKVARSPIWARFQKDDTVIERKVFFLDESWVEGRKMDAASALYQDEDGNNKNASKEGCFESDSSPTKSVTKQETSPKAPTSAETDFSVSFAAHPATSSITTNDILTSWFFRLVDCAVGLMPYNFRNRLGVCCTDFDAGSYAMAIPYTAKDYATPMLIQTSRATGQRAHHHETTLPAPNGSSKYAVSADWRSFQKKGGLVLGASGECKQILHLPCYEAKDIVHIPKSISFVHLFNAGPNGEPAMSVIASKAIMEKVQASGIVKKMIFESEGSTSDAFLESVQEAAAGRRQSVYAPLLTVESLSTMLDDEG